MIAVAVIRAAVNHMLHNLGLLYWLAIRVVGLVHNKTVVVDIDSVPRAL